MSMKVNDAQKDYLDNTITVTFTGEYNYHCLIEAVKKSYPDVEGEILDVSKPYKYKSFNQPGIVILK